MEAVPPAPAEAGGSPPPDNAPPAGAEPRARAPVAAHRCALCPEGKPPLSAGDLGQLVGPVHAGSGAYEECWVHRTCAEWSPEVFWEEEQLRNLGAAIRRGRQMTCAHCGGQGATLGCVVAACRCSYHYACARAGKAQVRSSTPANPTRRVLRLARRGRGWSPASCTTSRSWTRSAF